MSHSSAWARSLSSSSRSNCRSASLKKTSSPVAWRRPDRRAAPYPVLTAVPHHANALVPQTPRVDDRRAAVPGAVVDDHHLEVAREPGAHRQGGLDHRADGALFVEDRKHQGKGRPGRMRRRNRGRAGFGGRARQGILLFGSLGSGRALLEIAQDAQAFRDEGVLFGRVGAGCRVGAAGVGRLPRDAHPVQQPRGDVHERPGR